MPCPQHYLKGSFAQKLFFFFGLMIALLSLLPSVNVVKAGVFEDQLISLINQERSKNNLPSYNTSDKLTQSSLKHNQTMYNCSLKYGNSACFTHQVSLVNESSLMDRINATGYNAQAVAENIGWGQTSSGQIFTAWMNSSGHKANILNSTYKDIGCSLLNTASGSYSGMWWTCNFGKSFSAQPSSSPSIKPSASPSVKPSSSPSIKPSSTPTVSPSVFVWPRASANWSPSPSPSSKPWWCAVIPSSRYCT